MNNNGTGLVLASVALADHPLREFPTPEQIYTAIFDLPFAFSLRDEVAWPSRLPVHPRMRGERIADRIGDTTAQRELIVAQSTGMRRDCLFKA